MIELGVTQTLTVIKEKDFGVYLAERGGAPGKEETGVLLPKKQVPEGAKPGDELSVFIYKDSEDRLIATTAAPKVEIGRLAVLEVREVSKIGAFLDMGLERDLLLPFKEQTHPVLKGEKCLVALYVDKSKRLAATMKIYQYLREESPYRTGDEVDGFIFEINPDMGAFVAVDNCYYGMIPKRELFTGFQEGQSVHARVTKVRDDGKLDLSAREKSHVQIYDDATVVMKVIERYGGVLPFTDKASPEQIAKEFHLSKNAFKRAVGHLLKDGKIEITDKNIKIAEGKR